MDEPAFSRGPLRVDARTRCSIVHHVSEFAFAGTDSLDAQEPSLGK
jgi:hypothetical protein